MKHRICLILFLIMIMTYSFAIDNSGANIPELYQGLYPVKYDESENVVFTNKNDSNWYNYTEGKWANAVTLDKVGQMNPAEATEENITGYYVWIPRYAYQIRTGYNSSATGRIDIRFLKGQSNKDSNGKEYYTVEAFENQSNRWEELNTITYVGDRQMEYLVHPAFRFDQELSGIWVGKHEASQGIERELELVNTIPNDALWTSIDIQSSIEEIRNMVSKSENYDKYNLYGLSEDVNTHLIKAVEYGAVVYLANSMYGDNTATEVYRVDGIDSVKEYIAAGLENTIDVIDDKYIDTYKKDGEIIDIKGSAYLETSDGENAWENQTINNITDTNGIIVKENAYGIVASNGEETDVGFRVVLTKGENKNEIKEAYKKDGSYWWLMNNGDLWAMGNNEDGQLGIGNNEYKYIPIKVETDKDGNKIPAIERVVGIEDKIYYIAKNGDKYLNGSKDTDEINLEDDTINIVENLRQEQLEEYNELGEIKSIYGNATSTVFEEVDGDIYVIGENQNNKLGISGIANITTPMKLSIKGIKDVGIGSDFGVFLQDNGNIIGYGNSNKNGNGLTNISQIAVQNDKAYFMRASGIVVDNQSNIISSDAYKIAAGANHLVILKKDGTTETYGQVNSNLTNVIDIFAGKNMTACITGDNKTYLMVDDSLTELAIKNIVYAELNGSEPYFLTYDRELIYKSGAYVTVGETKLHRIREIKGDIVLTENNKLYNFGDVMDYEKTITDDRIEIKTMKEEKVIDFKIYGESIQGKNLIPYPYVSSTKTIHGLTFTLNNDGSVTVNGTSTHDAVINFSLCDYETLILKPGVYTVSANTDASSDSVYMVVGGSSSIFNGYIYVKGSDKTFTVEKEGNIGTIVIQVAAGATVDNVTFKPQLEKGSVATEWESPVVSPENPIEIKSVGEKSKNIFDVNDFIKTFTPHFLNESQKPKIEVFDGYECLHYWGGLSEEGRNIKYMQGEFKQKTQYTISLDIYDVLSSVNNYSGITLYVNYTDGSRSSILPYNRKDRVWENINFTTELGKTVDYIAQSFGTGSGHSYIKNFQIEEGDTATEYEPYYEGYKIPITVSGKNLFDGVFEIGFIDITTGENVNTSNSFYWRTKNYIEIVPNMVFSYKQYSLDSGLFVFCYDENKNFLGKTEKIYNSISNITNDKFIEGTKYIRIYWELSAPTTDVKTVFDYVQVEQGSTVTIYEPYLEPRSYDVYLDEPLRKIGDYADYIDFENQKVVRTIKELIVNGTENWVLNWGNIAYGFRLPMANVKRAIDGKQNEVLSNFYKKSNQSNIYYKFEDKVIGSMNDANAIMIRDTSISSLDDFKTFLSDKYNVGTPVKVNYVLDIPKEESIELPEILLHKGTNIIEIGTDIAPSKVEISYIGTILD